MIPIATTTLSTTASNITFSSIPQNYEHLQIRFIAQASGAAYGKVTFNSDTGTSYYSHSLEGKGTSVAAGAYAGTSYNSMLIGVNAFSTAANVFTSAIIDIFDYTSTSKNKTIRTLDGWDANGSGFINYTSGSWSATPTAITSINIALSSGNFTQYSSFALYGIKRAGA
jgi:hypothetical protein